MNPSPHSRAFVSLVTLAAAACSNPAGAGPDLDPVQAPPVARAKAPDVPPGTAARSVVPVVKVATEGLPSMGNPDALVTIVEFTDYQCPFCQRAEKTLDRLRATYGDALRVVIAETPLPIHDRARPAALAALAADRQGQFAAMHARLFGLAGQLSDADIDGAARALGLDMARFAADRADPALLAASEAVARRAGVSGTPSFLIGGRFVPGAQPFETFRDVIDERLGVARALVASGVRPRDVNATLTANGVERVAPDHDKDDGEGCGGADSCDDAPPVNDKVESVPIDGDPSRGPANAPIVVVAFEDFQCPYCAHGNANLQAFEAAHPGNVRVVFKNLPLPMHADAQGAALAAMAADSQGHFWDLHDQLFSHQGTLDRATIERLAVGLGLDAPRFDRDIADPATAARVARDEADAQALGVKGTPTFFVNGHRVVGAQPLATFEAALARAPKR